MLLFRASYYSGHISLMALSVSVCNNTISVPLMLHRKVSQLHPLLAIGLHSLVFRVVKSLPLAYSVVYLQYNDGQMWCGLYWLLMQMYGWQYRSKWGIIWYIMYRVAQKNWDHFLYTLTLPNI